MPVGRASNRRELTVVALAVGGVLVAVGALVVVLRLARGGDIEVRLGSETFDAGLVEHMAGLVASGGPLLFSDPSGGSRDLYLNHVGDSVEVGSVAFAARPEGSTRDCFVRWQPEQDAFRDTCTGATYPPDGTGLEQFPVTVTAGKLVVDINRSAERKAQRTTTSSVVESGIPRSVTTTASVPTSTTTR